MAKIKGVVFDVDGTLYNQDLLRLMMIGKMMQAFLTSPKKFQSEFKIIKEFRKVQERFRLDGNSVIDENSQIKKTSENLNADLKEVSKVVNKWFNEIPLPLIVKCKKRGLNKTFSELKNKGYKLALYSDYPSETKAKALDIRKYVEVISCSSDPDVSKFKPAPEGFRRTAEKMNLKCEELIYVGDRYEVDIIGSSGVGMTPVLIKSFKSKKFTTSYHICDDLYSIVKLVDKINETK